MDFIKWVTGERGVVAFRKTSIDIVSISFRDDYSIISINVKGDDYDVSLPTAEANKKFNEILELLENEAIIKSDSVLV